MPSIYLAGPEVFHRDAEALGIEKQRLCAARGLVGLYPLDGAVPAGASPAALAQAIYVANIGMIRRADAVIANLTPFRGPGADAGTVFELGLAAALGKPVAAYRNIDGDYRQRVARWNGGDLIPDGPDLRDRDGLLVEDFGLGDNLMIDCTLIEAGRPVVDVASTDPFDLAGFTACLDLLQPLLIAASASGA